MSGKVALVTGGSRGIGAAICRRLASDGASLVFTYGPSKKAARNLAESIESTRGKATAIGPNCGDDVQNGRIIERVVRLCGRLDSQ